MHSLLSSAILHLWTCQQAEAQETRRIGIDPATTTTTTGDRRAALIIGVDDYLDPRIADLQYPDNDARGLASRLIESGRFSKDDVLQMVPTALDPALRPTRANILAQLARLQSRSDLDMLVVYFSGHGSAEQVGSVRENYIFPVDTRRDVLNATAVRVSDLVALVSAIPARTRLIVFDACRTPPGTRGVAASDGFQDERYALAEGMGIIYGARFNSPAYEEDELQHGAFTGYLLEGLGGRADGWAGVGPSDGVVSFREAYQYAADQLQLLPRDGGPQMPFLDGEIYGDPGLVWVAPGDRPAPCPSRADDVAVLQAIALRACSDPSHFSTYARDAQRALACLGTPLTPALAIRAHQIDALYNLELLDRDAAARSWRAATLVSQETRLRLEVPTTCLPDLALRNAAEGLAIGVRPAPSAPAQGELLIDGSPASTLTEGVPTYVQVRWDREMADPPDRLALTEDASATPTPLYADHVEPYGSERRRLLVSRRLSLAGGGSVLLAGGMYAGGLALEARWREDYAAASKDSASVGDAERRETARALESDLRQVNAMWLGAQAVTTVAVGLAVTALVVRF